MPYLSRSRRKSRKSRATKSRKANSVWVTKGSSNGNTLLHKVCNRDYFNTSIDESVISKFEKYPFLANTVNKNGETPLDLLCKQYNHPKNSEEFMGFDDRQSLLSLIEELEMSYNAKLNTCSIGRSR